MSTSHPLEGKQVEVSFKSSLGSRRIKLTGTFEWIGQSTRACVVGGAVVSQREWNGAKYIVK
jgi:hypothetical protein